MKKVISLLLVVIFTILLIACNAKPHLVLTDRISVMESQKFVAYTTDYRVTLSVGRKESPFLPDGNVGNVVEYVRVEVTPAKLGLIERSHTIIVDEKEYNLVRMGNRYCLTAQIDAVPASLTVQLKSDDQTCDVKLSHINEGILDEDKILRALWSEFGEIIKESVQNKEVIINIIEDKDAPNGYHIYAGIVGSTAVYNAILLDADYKLVSKI